MQRFRGRCLRRARTRVGLFLNFRDRSGNLLRQLFPGRRKFMFPLFHRHTPLGGNGLRRHFARGGLNLLFRVGHQPRHVPRQLQ